MKKLIDTIKEIKKILYSIQVILETEYNDLLDYNNFNNSDILKSVEKKRTLFKKFFILNQNRKSIEKKCGIFEPYKKFNELNHEWNKIVKKCFLLQELNLKNKMLINKKFYLNQYFLELFSSDKKSITYNVDGKIKIS